MSTRPSNPHEPQARNPSKTGVNALEDAPWRHAGPEFRWRSSGLQILLLNRGSRTTICAAEFFA
jgi:hypothetical protein